MGEFMDELNMMADNIERSDQLDEVSPLDTQRWQALFDMSHAQAKCAIEEYRLDYTRNGISDELWSDVKEEMEELGHDRESYEYSLQRSQPKAQVAGPLKGMFLVKLEEPLTPDNIREASGVTDMPPISEGRAENGDLSGTLDTSFATVDGKARQNILDWLSHRAPWFTPTIIKISIAEKSLNSHNAGPMLGVDATMPQNLCEDSSISVALPPQDEYPVWYFFYGTLADPTILADRLGLSGDDRPAALHRATIHGGRIRTWADKYRALVDNFSWTSGSAVEGYAYLVQTEEQEDALRIYETDKYEVVRCDIETQLPSGSRLRKRGLTFRFAGDESELDGE